MDDSAAVAALERDLLADTATIAALKRDLLADTATIAALQRENVSARATLGCSRAASTAGLLDRSPIDWFLGR
jgi:hypothetical protein